MKLIRKILFPFVPLYYLVTWTRNKLFDFGLKQSTSYNIPIICVGNLSTGGTGKTPMIEYLIRLLKANFKIATLSRGYKRKTKGFVLASPITTVNDIGDEPFQFYNKFKQDVTVAVDANRNNGIKMLRQLDHNLEVILLDDAYQHRYVKAGFNILLSTYSNLYTNDMVLPTGNLREPRSGAQRAHAIIVTKCPIGITKQDKAAVLSKIKPTKGQMVFFSVIKYASFVYGSAGQLTLKQLPKKFTLVTGIANAKPLVNYLKRKNATFEHLNYNDHYNFTKQDVINLQEKTCIVTTEKDYMRLKQYKSIKHKLYYLPIEAHLDDADAFKELVTNFLSNFKHY